MYCTYQHSTYTTYIYNVQHTRIIHINTAHIINETTSNLHKFSNSIIINSKFSSELTFEHVYFAAPCSTCARVANSIPARPSPAYVSVPAPLSDPSPPSFPLQSSCSLLRGHRVAKTGV